MSFGGSTSLQEEDERKWDFSCESGLKYFWRIKAPQKLLKQTSAMVVCLDIILMDSFIALSKHPPIGDVNIATTSGNAFMMTGRRRVMLICG